MIPVVFVVIYGTGLGLAGLVESVAESVVHIVIKTVSASKLSLPPPSGVCIDVALEEIWYILSTRVLYGSIPTISVTAGYGRDFMILSTAVGGHIGGSVR